MGKLGGHKVAEVALWADVLDLCAVRLKRVTGTYGLVLDGVPAVAPVVAGVASWVVLRRGSPAHSWDGSLRADVTNLPFADDSFCAILVRFVGDADAAEAAELARVLAPHGTLLVTGFHPRSWWRRGVPPEHWERALRAAGLDVRPALRCGAPWPRPRGATGLPHWLVRSTGGAWVVEARRNVLSRLPLRRRVDRYRAREHDALVTSARRLCA